MEAKLSYSMEAFVVFIIVIFMVLLMQEKSSVGFYIKLVMHTLIYNSNNLEKTKSISSLFSISNGFVEQCNTDQKRQNV